MEQPSSYAWACGSSPWRDYNYDKTTSNAEEEKEEVERKKKKKTASEHIRIVVSGTTMDRRCTSWYLILCWSKQSW